MNATLYNRLLELARSRELTSYGDIAPCVNLDIRSDAGQHQLAQLLEEIAVFEQQANRPMLTALVIRRGHGNHPGEGFFSLAQRFHRFDGSRNSITRMTFWTNEVAAVHDYWNQNPA